MTFCHLLQKLQKRKTMYKLIPQNLLTHNVVLTCSGDIKIIFKENIQTSMYEIHI